MTAADLMNANFNDREFVIDPFLRDGESMLIWAGTGVGKTMLTLSLAIMMAGGGRVWEWACDKPRKVLLIDGEMHKQDIRNRLVMLSSGAVNGANLEAFGENLTLICRQAQDPNSIFYDITDPDHQSHILKLCMQKEIEVLIIDNLSTVSDGLLDENDATAFRSVQSFMLKMKQAGITTILVHHARKDGKELRGSSAMETTFEVILGLTRPEVPVQGKASFVAKFTKLRAQGSHLTAPRLWTLEDQEWKVEDDSDDELTATLRALESNKFISQKELADHFQISEGTISKRFRKLIAAGRITKEGIKMHQGRAKEVREAMACDQPDESFDLGPDDKPDF